MRTSASGRRVNPRRGRAQKPPRVDNQGQQSASLAAYRCEAHSCLICSAVVALELLPRPSQIHHLRAAESAVDNCYRAFDAARLAGCESHGKCALRL
jgi:hypothetical protein